MANPIKKCVLHGAVNNETVDLYPRTNLASVEDMTAFSRTLNGAADAATARNTLEIQTIKDIINIIYPVGSVITLTNDTDPNETYQGTTWVKMDAGLVLVSAGTYTENGTTYTYNLGDKGGEAKHQSTVEEMPSHNHKGSTSTASLTGHFSTNLGTDQSASFSGIINSAIYKGGWRCKADGDRNKLNGFNIDASHSHTISLDNTGGSQAHENRMPYIVVNRWKRTN